MDINANDVIDKLLEQIKNYSRNTAILEAQVDKLLKENEELKKKLNTKSVADSGA